MCYTCWSRCWWAACSSILMLTFFLDWPSWAMLLLILTPILLIWWFSRIICCCSLFLMYFNVMNVIMDQLGYSCDGNDGTVDLDLNLPMRINFLSGLGAWYLFCRVLYCTGLYRCCDGFFGATFICIPWHSLSRSYPQLIHTSHLLFYLFKCRCQFNVDPIFLYLPFLNRSTSCYLGIGLFSIFS